MNTFARSTAIRSLAGHLHSHAITSPGGVAFRALPASGLRFASNTKGGEAPRSESPPAAPGEVKNDNSMLKIGGLGLAVGAVFLYMLSRPEKAAEASKFGQDKGEHNQGSGAGSRTAGQRAA
ncbi:hypothetical protein MGN70_008944 [Eutypa lata]|uniref:Uncharacterized protein n=1 Tax=Eutypa lata (strain UCR-EL1) TaxID=1287681 RepID=M7T7R5_EUTLA|nr:hypothetical protein UCREL1_10368 [Eutypa lata UCREL1]KAI1249332.1 hypothetical protein MGN70_008944 [Eutypa lata]